MPEPLLPPQMALQNPELVGGELFHVLPALGQILVMIDADGDENYVPHVIPLDGGFPEPLADEPFSGGRSHLVHVDDDAEIAYFAVESREEASITAVRVHLPTRATEELWQSSYGAMVAAWTPDHSRVVLVDGYTMGDTVLYEIDDAGTRRIESVELAMVPKTTVAVSDESTARRIMNLVDGLEETEDVQDVYANFDIPEAVLEAVAS